MDGLKRETSNLLQLHDHDLDRQGSHGRGSGRHHFVQVQFELLALRAKSLKEITLTIIGISSCSPCVQGAYKKTLAVGLLARMDGLKRETSNLLQLHDHDLDRQGHMAVGQVDITSCRCSSSCSPCVQRA